MFDELPGTRGTGEAGVVTALATALGLHGLAFLVLPAAGALFLATVDPPPIPVRFFSSAAAPPEPAPSEDGSGQSPERLSQLPADRIGRTAARASLDSPVAAPIPLATLATLAIGGGRGGAGRSGAGSREREDRDAAGTRSGAHRGRKDGLLTGVEGGVSSSFGDAPLQVGGDVQAPEVIEQVKPVYPELALLARHEGLVILSAIINTAGVVEDVSVLAGDPVLSRAAMEAITRWRFRPGRLNGNPVKVSFTLTVRFVLEDPPPPEAPGGVDAAAAPPGNATSL